MAYGVLGGDIIEAVDFITVTKTSSGIFTPNAGWTVTTQVARVLSGIKLITLRFEFTYTGANIVPAGTSNITDTSLGTVATTWRPTEPQQFVWGTGAGVGEGVVGSDGNTIIRAYDATLTSGNTVRFNLAFVTD